MTHTQPTDDILGQPVYIDPDAKTVQLSDKQYQHLQEKLSEVEETLHEQKQTINDLKQQVKQLKDEKIEIDSWKNHFSQAYRNELTIHSSDIRKFGDLKKENEALKLDNKDLLQSLTLFYRIAQSSPDDSSTQLLEKVMKKGKEKELKHILEYSESHENE